MVEKPAYQAMENRIIQLEAELAKSKRFEEINHALFQISSAVNMTSTLDELYRSIHSVLGAIIDTTNFYIALYDHTKDIVTLPYCVDMVDDCYPSVIDVSRTESLTAEVIRTGQPLWMTKAEILARRAKTSFKIPACTPSEVWLGVPLKTPDKIIGVMAVQNYHDPMCYDQMDMDVMVSVAGQIAIAIERKKEEDARKKAEQHLRLIFDSVPAMIWQKDKQGKYLQVNRAYCMAVGLPEKGILGKTDHDLFPEEIADQYVSLDRKILHFGIPELDIKEPHQKRSGELGWSLTNKLPFCNDEGVIAGTIGFAIDITLRRQAEDALRESEEKYRMLFEDARNPILVVDENGRYMDANHAALHFLECSREDLLNRHVWDFAPPSLLEKQLQEHFPFAIHRTFETKYLVHRAIKTLLLNVVPLKLKGKTVLYGIGLDITERKEMEQALRDSEKNYREIFNSTSESIMIDDAGTGKIIDVNETTLRMFGYGCKEELLAGNIGELSANISPYTEDEAQKLVQKCNHDGSQVFEWLAKKKTGETFWTEVSLRKSEIGGKGKILAVVRDISDRKRIETEKAELETRKRQLQKAESLGRMAGAISHNFNNQLQVVIGNLEMAMADLPRDSDYFRNMTEALKASRNAAGISGMMLTYLGQTSGGQEPLDLSTACRLNLPLLQSAMPKHIILDADLPSPGPIVRANAHQIQHILTHLVTNARESIDDDTGSIHLSVKTVSSADIPATHRFPPDWQPHDQLYACLEVSDNGRGIAETDIEKVFDPFFTTRFTGRGLGLSVVHGIVRAHSGAILVQSGAGMGSVFCVCFPVTDEAVACHPEKPEAAPLGERSRTVLVVEDEKQIRSMLNSVLTRQGFTVLEAGDGLEAVEIFRQHRDEIGCVLSDLTMPRMNGWEMLEALRDISPDIPVILSSGYDEARVMADKHSQRPSAFLSKPYQLKTLGETIYRVICVSPTTSLHGRTVGR